MRLDALTLAIRPRHPYEAADLGARLVQDQAGLLYRCWLIVLVPLTLGLLCLEWLTGWSMALLALWWLKPLYDYCLLWVLSRAVFGERPGALSLLGALPGFLRHGLPGALLLRRFSWRRTFLLPVWLLEGLSGPEHDRRLAVILQRHGGKALMLLQVFALAELAVLFSLYALVVLFAPAGLGFDELRPLLQAPVGSLAHVGLVLLYVLAVLVVEPAYVAAGFLMYLNRRTDLEAWDIEIAFRRLAGRLHEGDAS